MHVIYIGKNDGCQQGVLICCFDHVKGARVFEAIEHIILYCFLDACKVENDSTSYLCRKHFSFSSTQTKQNFSSLFYLIATRNSFQSA